MILWFISAIQTLCTINKNGKKLQFNSFILNLLRKDYMKQVLKKMYHYLKNHEATNELTIFLEYVAIYIKSIKMFFMFTRQKLI